MNKFFEETTPIPEFTSQDRDKFTQTLLTSVWDIHTATRAQFKIPVNFLLKWHRNYLEDKTHLEVSKDNEFIPYIYRDETKFYILPYNNFQPGSSDYVWLSFRKCSYQPHGYVLIKKVKNATNTNKEKLLYTGVTRS